MKDEYLTPAEAGEMLKVHKRTIVALLKTGKMKGVKVGKEWRVRREDLDNYLNRVE